MAVWGEEGDFELLAVSMIWRKNDHVRVHVRERCLSRKAAEMLKVQAWMPNLQLQVSQVAAKRKSGADLAAVLCKRA